MGSAGTYLCPRTDNRQQRTEPENRPKARPRETRVNITSVALIAFGTAISTPFCTYRFLRPEQNTDLSEWARHVPGMFETGCCCCSAQHWGGITELPLRKLPSNMFWNLWGGTASKKVTLTFPFRIQFQNCLYILIPPEFHCKIASILRFYPLFSRFYPL